MKLQSAALVKANHGGQRLRMVIDVPYESVYACIHEFSEDESTSVLGTEFLEVMTQANKIVLSTST